MVFFERRKNLLRTPGVLRITPRVRYTLIETPRDLIGRLRVDALSEVLKALRLTSGIYLKAEFTAPWCIDSSPSREDLEDILPGAEQVALYHLLTEGSCRASLPDGSAAVELGVGDLILFPQGDGHLMGSDLRLPPAHVATLVTPAVEGGLMRMGRCGDGARTSFVCGYLAYDGRLCRPLFSALPRLVRLPLAGGPAADWIINTLQRGADETRAPRGEPEINHKLK